MKQVETQLSDQEYEVFKSYKEENGLKTDFQAMKELVRALDTLDYNQDFEAKRGRKGRIERAVTDERFTGVEFIERHIGSSDTYHDSEKFKIKKRVMNKAHEDGRKISVVDFDKWWFDPIVRSVPSGYQFGQEETVKEETSETLFDDWLKNLSLKKIG